MGHEIDGSNPFSGSRGLLARLPGEGPATSLVSEQDEERPPLVDAREVHKHFGGEPALTGARLRLEHGEIHALLGENGAGKSTLIKILAGVVRADAASIAVGGATMKSHFSAADVRDAGLAFVHQDLGLAEHLSVAENIALAIGYKHRGGLISFKATERAVADLLDEVGIELAPRALVRSLSQDEKVMVAVARAFALHAKAVVLDEVSSSLPGPAVERLASALRASSATGAGFIYVTHRLEEVFAFCDRVTVLRDGRNVASAAVSDITRDQLVGWILGPAATSDTAPTRSASSGSITLRVRQLTGPGLTTPFSLDAREGEIVAICGLVGCGARDVAGLLGGATRPSSGTTTFSDDALRLGSPSALRSAGCTYVPGSRQTAGGVFALSVRENMFLSRMRVGGVLDSRLRWPPSEREAAIALGERFEVQPRRPDAALVSLSGGNQQKVIVGRALRSSPRLLVVDDPTAGVDVGSRLQLHRLIREAADCGTVVVMASTDFEEVAAIADRAIVMCAGVAHAELSGDRLTAARIAEASYGMAPDIESAGDR